MNDFDDKYNKAHMGYLMNNSETISMKPIIHGKWQYHLMPLALKCSYCKRTVTWKRKIDYNYCPYCGATMDGD